MQSSVNTTCALHGIGNSPNTTSIVFLYESSSTNSAVVKVCPIGNKTEENSDEIELFALYSFERDVDLSKVLYTARGNSASIIKS